MKTRKFSISAMLLASFVLLLQLSSLASAQDDSWSDNNGQIQDDQTQDPPSRVARLSDSEGSISFRPAGEDDWVNGVPNRPMVTGDDLWADEDSRAEVTVGSAAIRLGAKTGITFLELDDHTTQIRLAEGSLIVNARHVDDDDNYEIDTPNIALTLLQPGEYRIDVNEDGSQTVTTVFHGRGRVTGGGYTYTVVAGQSASFAGGDQLQYDLQQLPAQDDLDSWAFSRDEQEDDADSANYVSREMTGYEDLDANGDWSYVAGYGTCWQPRGIAVGWAPYRFGHWIWVGPWGWTWVENEPWGFAPFHYGRWAFVNNGWFWVPGPVVVRPVWTPALVGFVGGSAGFRFSAGVGVGWFPLAPGEVFVPGYRVSRTYVNSVNVTNTTVSVAQVANAYSAVAVNKTVTNITYANQHVANGVTIVSRDAFVNARPVAQNMMRVDAKEVTSAPVSRLVAAEPNRSSVIGTGKSASLKPPATVIGRQVVAVRTPPSPQPSIAQRQAQAGGHLNQQALVRPVEAARTQSNQIQPNKDGFRPFSSSGGNGQVRQMQQPQPHVFEQQGRSESENSGSDDQNGAIRNGQSQNRNAQTAGRPVTSPQSHPLVKAAPPVQDRNPQQEQQQEQKFNQWQQQRPAATAKPSSQAKPASASRPAPASAAPKTGH
jgi:hypothetical protein